jgi:hypothetical protein
VDVLHLVLAGAGDALRRQQGHAGDEGRDHVLAPIAGHALVVVSQGAEAVLLHQGAQGGGNDVGNLLGGLLGGGQKQ